MDLINVVVCIIIAERSNRQGTCQVQRHRQAGDDSLHRNVARTRDGPLHGLFLREAGLPVPGFSGWHQVQHHYAQVQIPWQGSHRLSLSGHLSPLVY